MPRSARRGPGPSPAPPAPEQKTPQPCRPRTARYQPPVRPVELPRYPPMPSAGPAAAPPRARFRTPRLTAWSCGRRAGQSAPRQQRAHPAPTPTRRGRQSAGSLRGHRRPPTGRPVRPARSADAVPHRGAGGRSLVAGAPQWRQYRLVPRHADTPLRAGSRIAWPAPPPPHQGVPAPCGIDRPAPGDTR